YVNEEHIFRVTAIDSDGNKDSYETSVTFKDDKTDPPPSIRMDMNYKGELELEAEDVAWNKGFKTITLQRGGTIIKTYTPKENVFTIKIPIEELELPFGEKSTYIATATDNNNQTTTATLTLNYMHSYNKK
ncbi:MAG: hypothetical protein Q7R56_00340, partial [Nanoarchaeota archaeon]|nr:hypothetical protein [Nanoarchaeota archaeon]